MKLLGALCLLVLLCGTHAAISDRHTEGLVSLFTFTGGELYGIGIGGEPDQVSSQLLGDLDVNSQDAKYLEKSVGVNLVGSKDLGSNSRSFRVRSEKRSDSGLLAQLNNEFSFEIWFKPRLTNYNTYIANFPGHDVFQDCGSDRGTSTDDGRDGAAHGGMYLFFKDGSMTFEVAGTSGAFISCASAQAVAVSAGELHHVVGTLAFEDGTDPQFRARLFIDGVRAGSSGVGTGSVDTSKWKGSQFQIGFPSKEPTGSEVASLDGEVYLAAFYNDVLTDDEILQNFNAGLANSKPFVEDIDLVHVDEDVAGPIPLTATDIDDDDVTIEVTSMPFGEEGFVGTLFAADIGDTSSNGVALTQASLPYSFDPSAKEIRYLAAENEFSGTADQADGIPYASFTFQAHDGQTYSRINATASILVDPVNDIPFATNTTATPFAEVRYDIELTGTDPNDFLDSITKVRVTTRPSFGDLYRNGNSRITSTPSTITANSEGKFIVTYLSDSISGSDKSGQDIVLNDLFQFEVGDDGVGGSDVLYSADGYVTVTVKNPLEATPLNPGSASSGLFYEDQASAFSLAPVDVRSNNDAYEIYFASIPTTGTLYTFANATHKVPLFEDPTNVTLPYKVSDGANNINFYYQPNANEFGVNQGQLTYYLQSTVDGWRSATSTVAFTITAVNDAPVLELRDSKNALLSQGISKSIIQHSSVNSSYLINVTLSDVDPDAGEMWRTTINVRGYGASVTLDESVNQLVTLGRLNFIAGDGDTDVVCIFEAGKEDTKQALDLIQFYSPGVGFKILEITVKDNAVSSPRQTTFTLDFVVEEDVNLASSSSLPIDLTLTVLVIIIAIGLCVCCGFYFICIRSCRRASKDEH